MNTNPKQEVGGKRTDKETTANSKKKKKKVSKQTCKFIHLQEKVPSYSSLHGENYTSLR